MASENVPAEVFPPGDFIREELEERNWTQEDLAAILGRPLRTVNEVISGKRGITPETATGLAAAFGTSPQLWLNLESAYQLWRAEKRIRNTDIVAKRALVYSKAPINEMIRRHWIEGTKNIDVLEQRLLDFFKIADLDEQPQFAGHAARKSTSYEVTTPAQLAWLFRARQLAPAVHAGHFSPGNIRPLIDSLRSLAGTQEDVRRVPRVMSDYGVRLLVVEPLKGTKIDGVAFWLDSKSPVVVISMRYDRIDYFWYTLAHELGHIRSGDGQQDDLHIDKGFGSDPGGRKKPAAEERADRFAANALIPQDKLDDFIIRVGPLYTPMKLRGFAARMKIHPGIVIGQLQYRGELSFSQYRNSLSPVRRILTEAALTDGWKTTLPAALS